MKHLQTRHRFLRHLPVYPFIYGAGVFVILLDLVIEIYHRISFPIYGIKYLKRKNYIKIDRHKLSYLNPMQKFNCIYCGYVNGVILYISKIIAATEFYWCGIKHVESPGFIPPEHHKEFVEYGNKVQFDLVYDSKKVRML